MSGREPIYGARSTSVTRKRNGSRRRGFLRLFWVALSAAAACGGSSATSGPDLRHGMTLTGSASLAQDSVSGTVAVVAILTVKNEADTTVRVYWAECPSNGPLVLYAYRRTTDTPVWNATDAYRRVACFLVRYYSEIGPHQTWHHTTTVPVRDILGDSLSPGGYHLTGSAKWLEPGFAGELVLGDLNLLPQ